MFCEPFKYMKSGGTQERMREDNSKDDTDFFNGVKSALLDLCDSNSDIAEFQRFKDCLSKTYSFEELLNIINKE